MGAVMLVVSIIDISNSSIMINTTSTINIGITNSVIAIISSPGHPPSATPAPGPRSEGCTP